MKIIKKANPLVEAILPKISLATTNTTRLNNFCCVFYIDNNRLIYNGLTGEVIFEDERDEAYLYSHHYYVSVDYNEFKLVNELKTTINLIKQSSIKGINNYTILTTNDCNARCFYCYQKCSEKLYMDTDVSNKVFEYMLNHIDKNIKVNITWFGGEPLLNVNAIDIIVNQLNKNKISFTSNIVSNGSLFNNEIINRCNNLWNIKNIQITLDGTKNIYNKTKNYIDDKNVYEKIIENISLLISNNINVSIRLNLTRNNYRDLKELIDFLYVKFDKNKHYKVYVSLLYQDENNLEIISDLYKQKIELEKYIYYLGIYENKIDLDIKTNNCIADDLNSIVILPDGSLSCCEHIQEEIRWGSIFSNNNKLDKCLNIDNNIISPFEFWKEKDDIKDECKNCFYYPLCINIKRCPGKSCYCLDIMRQEYMLKLEWKIKELYYSSLT